MQPPKDERSGQGASRGGRRTKGWPLRLLEHLLAAGVLVGAAAVAADAAFRPFPEGVRLGRHLVASVGIAAAQASVAALLAWAAITVEWTLTSRLAVRAPRLAATARSAFYALGVGLASWSTAHWAFTGRAVSGSWWAVWGPLFAVSAMAIVAAIMAWLVATAATSLRAGKAARALVVAGLCIAGSGFAVYLDLTVYVALYARLHTALELLALALGMTGFALGLGLLRHRSAWSRDLHRTLAMLAGGWLLCLAAVEPVRADLDRSLAHVWRQPLYVGRALRRLQLAESFLADPTAWRGSGMARVDRLRERFDIGTAAEAPEWSRPAPTVHPRLANAVEALRAGLQVRNVLVYYVDTLRGDAASDPAVMPNLVTFSRSALSFTRAYTAAPDTVGALPVMLSGRFVPRPAEPNMLTVARDAGVRSALVIARSAGEFLSNQLPAFQFAERVPIGDYGDSQKVWGYGADRPTAAPVVDGALAWLDANSDQRFMLWLFQYDLHNWRELDRPYVYETAARLKLPDEAPLNWRYRVVAASVDAELGRLLEGLERRGLDRDTAVVVLSDHGEGLGAGGFWVHGIFLWDMLVRVPLAIRVPGVAPRVVDMPVGHVDLLATLGPLMAPKASLGVQHGEDLLQWALEPTHERRLPLLLSASSREQVVRIGIVDRRPPLKLVLPIESSEPELYDMDRPDPDDHDLAPTEPRRMMPLLDSLVRSPHFPRVPEDLSSSRWKGAGAQPAAAGGQAHRRD